MLLTFNNNYANIDLQQTKGACTITKDEANKIVDENNAAIDSYIANILPAELEKADCPVINGKINAAGWFKAQTILNNSGLYEKSMTTLKMLRAAGFDVKINMQDKKLTRA